MMKLKEFLKYNIPFLLCLILEISFFNLIGSVSLIQESIIISMIFCYLIFGIIFCIEGWLVQGLSDLSNPAFLREERLIFDCKK